MLERRKFLAGLGFIACAPAIVRASSLMPVRSWGELHAGDPILTVDTAVPGSDRTALWIIRGIGISGEPTIERIIGSWSAACILGEGWFREVTSA